MYSCVRINISIAYLFSPNFLAATKKSGHPWLRHCLIRLPKRRVNFLNKKLESRPLILMLILDECGTFADAFLNHFVCVCVCVCVQVFFSPINKTCLTYKWPPFSVRYQAFAVFLCKATNGFQTHFERPCETNFVQQDLSRSKYLSKRAPA